jgi:bifunctional ADP-heptose synthase (sugar kinase/adenylyltransferase)
MTFNGFEFEIEIKRQNLSESSFIKNLHLEYGVSTILITRGSRGTEIFRKGCNPIKSPAFAPYVTDRVGAGDALLSISSLLTAANCPPEIVGFLANVVGAWSVTFLGNSRHLEKSVLIKHVTSLLK